MKSISPLATSVLLVVLMGCEAPVDAFIGTPEPYTLWGVMNSGADTQRVRVFPVADEAGINQPGALDATVASVNLTTGERVEWNHREVPYDSASMGHVFWAPFRAQYGERYRLEVMRSDGAASTAEVTLPQPVELEIETQSDRTFLPVRILGDAPNLIGVEVRYEATNLPPKSPYPSGTLIHPLVEFPVEISYQEDLDPIAGGYEFDIQMQRDAGLVRREFENNCLVTPGVPGIALRRIEVHLIAADSAWALPEGGFDPEVLVQPNAFSNVENGFGFLGAGQIVRERWTPTRDIMQRLGYDLDQPCDDASDTPSCTQAPIPCIGENADSIWEIFFR